ncbi:MAG TPA: endonuclease III, partial [Chloroflexota bacterium]|nr:endonuclease III [Chloroflexota bacterium]
MMDRIGEAVRPFPKAALFELADDGFGSVFEQLVACIISIRTRDEVTLPVARKLFQHARTPEAVA